ncbi:glycerol-3-phosphate responsive antiterminator [Planococcus lenghuensis]|uniref:Glycerol uptake operon antiterminator regulatory protein n=1 Tax=Planococcus lenghuensis TaxID=2213202 RepID=A0A1Q2L4Y7_9BACL|nr:glycerol-3-phosphate responsive antiterminator [Planococcus lenghuensis]AQQ55471.1 transcriptional regulator [Planococcus lenghuensis]
MKMKWNKAELIRRLHLHKKIAAVKTPKGIEDALANKERISAIFLLTGSITTIKRYVDVFQESDVPVFIHAEKIGGLLLNNEGLDFISDFVKPFGIVTTKATVIKKAKERNLCVVQRVFMIDSEVYDNVLENKSGLNPDIIEIMPSTLHSVVAAYSTRMTTPIITGGLLSTVEQAESALNSGAIAISTSNEKLWTKDLSGF